MASKYARKRKSEFDEDTSGEARPEERRSSKRHSDQKKKRKSEDNSENGGGGGGGGEDSISIEETNRIRAELGLAPLEVNKPPQEDEDSEETPGERKFTEDGVEIVHKAAKNWSDDKTEAKIREKLDAQAKKRQIHQQLLKTSKGLADSDDEDDNPATWIERARAREEELNEMDANAEKEAEELKKRLDERKKARKAKEKKEAAMTGGLVVGHSKDAFVDGTETILVLQDKNVLDEDEDEILVNPNMVDDERHKRNVEMRKKKTDYNAYDEDEVDELGVVKKKAILSKYDEGLDGETQRETFRLDTEGGYDLDNEAKELELKRKLMMANKKFESLETPKFAIAREFYTEEEMVSFRKTKKKKPEKIRKRKTLKASDLEAEADQTTAAEKAEKAKRLAARRAEGAGVGHSSPSSSKAETNNAEMEEGEVKDEPSDKFVRPKWKDPSSSSVDLSRIKKLASSMKNVEEDDEESDDDDFGPTMNLAGVVIDDDADDELQAALEKTRLLRQGASAPTRSVGDILLSQRVKDEPMDSDDEMDGPSNKNDCVIIDQTSEQYKMIGEIQTIGLAGNRSNDVDYSELLEEKRRVAEEQKRIAEEQQLIKQEQASDSDSEDSSDEQTRNANGSDIEIDDLEEEAEKPMWKSFGEEEQPSSSTAGTRSRADAKSSRSHRESRHKRERDDDIYGADYKNVLGEERDVTKGVAAMMRLAAEKGYIRTVENKSDEGKLHHLESKRFSRVEQGRSDVDEKHLRKLERLGNIGGGPIRPFQEKKDYKPDIEINYTDSKGRVMEGREAFRALSHKFHGKRPGKKQIEKRQAQLDKKERLKKMNSSDTPLGTLDKQRKKQEQTQSAYILLSGGNRNAGAPLQKD